MTNALYGKAKQSLLGAGINFTSDTIKCVLVDTGDYTHSISADDNLDDIPAGARTATSAALSSKTVTDGVFDAADLTFSAVTGD